MSQPTAPEPPSTREALHKALEGHRAKVERWQAARTREIELEGRRELTHIERAVRALDSEPTHTGAHRSTGKGDRGKSPAALAAQRREAIMRLLDESGEGLAVSEVGSRLKITEFSTRSALKRLVKEGRVRRVGTGASTRYELRGRRRSSPAGGARSRGTLEGRILAIVADRTFASLEELAQATGASTEEVRRVCGGLIAERELQMSRHDDRPVYVVGARRAA